MVPWCLVVLGFGGAAASGQGRGLLWAAEVGWGRQRRTEGFVAAAVRSAQARSAGERSHLGERRRAVQRGVRQLEHARFPYLVRVKVRVRVRVGVRVMVRVRVRWLWTCAGFKLLNNNNHRIIIINSYNTRAFWSL